MRILMVNKFLYPNGGSETYIFKLGKQLIDMGHEVQYFGMEHEGRIVGNHVECYTSDMDFHTGRLSRLVYPFKIIYSVEARKKIRRVLYDFKPDVVHLNNFNFQITPSVIYEIRKYEKQMGERIKIVYTAHDYQLVCPNHMMNIPSNGENCRRCLDKGTMQCARNKCIHNSFVKSTIGTFEAMLYRVLHTYRKIDKIICPSKFMQKQIENNPDLAGRTLVMYNFVEREEEAIQKKENYILYFGRYSKEKGIKTLLQACRELPDYQFVFAGNGPLVEEVGHTLNVVNKGFLSGRELSDTIKRAKICIYPSEWYENCPFSVMEALENGTPVIGADIGGIPELIRNEKNGLLFESGNIEELKKCIRKLMLSEELYDKLLEGCIQQRFDTVEEYAEKLICIYR